MPSLVPGKEVDAFWYRVDLLHAWQLSFEQLRKEGRDRNLLIDVLRRIPEEHAKLDFLEEHPEDDRFVVLFRHAHENAASRKHEAWLLTMLFVAGAFDIFGAEGASEEKIDIDRFRAFPHRDSVEKAAEYLVREGKIGPCIYAGMVSTRPVLLFGLEDKKLYDAAVDKRVSGKPGYWDIVNQRVPVLVDNLLQRMNREQTRVAGVSLIDYNYWQAHAILTKRGIGHAGISSRTEGAWDTKSVDDRLKEQRRPTEPLAVMFKESEARKRSLEVLNRPADPEEPQSDDRSESRLERFAGRYPKVANVLAGTAVLIVSPFILALMLIKGLFTVLVWLVLLPIQVRDSIRASERFDFRTADKVSGSIGESARGVYGCTWSNAGLDVAGTIDTVVGEVEESISRLLKNSPAFRLRYRAICFSRVKDSRLYAMANRVEPLREISFRRGNHLRIVLCLQDVSMSYLMTRKFVIKSMSRAWAAEVIGNKTPWLATGVADLIARRCDTGVAVDPAHAALLRTAFSLSWLKTGRELFDFSATQYAALAAEDTTAIGFARLRAFTAQSSSFVQFLEEKWPGPFQKFMSELRSHGDLRTWFRDAFVIDENDAVIGWIEWLKERWDVPLMVPDTTAKPAVDRLLDIACDDGEPIVDRCFALRSLASLGYSSGRDIALSLSVDEENDPRVQAEALMLAKCLFRVDAKL